MIDIDNFLNTYNIKREIYDKTELVWTELMAIYDDYIIYKEELEPSAIYLFNTLMKAPNVHSVRYRIKNPEHLIEKIIRKKINTPGLNITLENYKEEFNDLIGLRALHLYKDEWESVNDYIREKWIMPKKPVANYRNGDSKELIDFFKQKDCDTKEHKYGYRSVHYIIETQPNKNKYFAEIQVRTIFEEAWSEIDHTIRYPYDLENVIFFQFLLILNRLAGSADEMGSYIKFLKTELSKKETEFGNQIEEKSQIITDLEKRIEKSNIQGEELKAVKKDLERLRRQQLSSSILDTKDYFVNINPGLPYQLPNLGGFSGLVIGLKNASDNLNVSSILAPSTALGMFAPTESIAPIITTKETIKTPPKAD